MSTRQHDRRARSGGPRRLTVSRRCAADPSPVGRQDCMHTRRRGNNACQMQRPTSTTLHIIHCSCYYRPRTHVPSRRGTARRRGAMHGRESATANRARGARNTLRFPSRALHARLKGQGASEAGGGATLKGQRSSCVCALVRVAAGCVRSPRQGHTYRGMRHDGGLPGRPRHEIFTARTLRQKSAGGAGGPADSLSEALSSSGAAAGRRGIAAARCVPSRLRRIPVLRQVVRDSRVAGK